MKKNEIEELNETNFVESPITKPDEIKVRRRRTKEEIAAAKALKEEAKKDADKSKKEMEFIAFNGMVSIVNALLSFAKINEITEVEATELNNAIDAVMQKYRVSFGDYMPEINLIFALGGIGLSRYLDYKFSKTAIKPQKIDIPVNRDTQPAVVVPPLTPPNNINPINIIG